MLTSTNAKQLGLKKINYLISVRLELGTNTWSQGRWSGQHGNLCEPS